MKDIENKSDIKVMVDAFYDKVKDDDLLGDIFRSKLHNNDWTPHLEQMYKFWNTVLLGTAEFRGSPFDKHIGLPVERAHFDRWLVLFNDTLNENFEGEVCESTKKRAQQIGLTFHYKIESLREEE